MKELISKPHLIFSIENPAHPVSKDFDTKLTNEHVINLLRQLGNPEVHPVKGRWSHDDGKSFKEENSIFVSSPNDAQKAAATKLAQASGQASVLYSSGTQHKNIITNGENVGKHNLGNSTKINEQVHPTQDYQTHMPDGTVFSHVLDWDTLHDN